MKFTIDNKEYEIVDIFNENNQNYMIYTDSVINKDKQNVYAAKIEINNKEIKLHEIDNEQDIKVINEKIKNIKGE